MNKRELFQWLNKQGCSVRPKEGINNTAPPIEVVNEKTGRYSYFALPTYTDQVSPNTIKKLISELGIEPPKSF